ncbi:MAG: periplasmic heavy metal sensor [Saprospiraceae bacterium]
MMNALPKVWKWVFGILILLNIVSLLLLWVRPKHPGPPPKGVEVLVDYFQKELQLDENQSNQFKTLIENHRKEVRQLNEKRKASKESMFEALTREQTDRNLVDSLARLAANVDLEIDQKLAEHYLQLKAVCNQNQQKQLGNLFLESIPKPPPPGGPR